MKIALAQIGTDPGRIDQNKQKILSYIEKAKSEGAELVIFPELTIPGYAAMDLFFSDGYIEANFEALREITKASKGIKTIVGFADIDQSRTRPDYKKLRYNSLALIEDGTITAIRDKTLLPEYDIFMEKRYFATSRRRDPVNLFNKKVGLQVCEDIYTWGYPVNLIGEYGEQGVDLVINISASPFSAGKRKIRDHWVKAAQKFAPVPFIYTNTVGSYDGYEGEVVFDGRSFIYNQHGSVVLQGSAFKEELLFHELENDKVLAHHDEDEIRDCYNALVYGLNQYARRTGFKKAVLGISGGIDSAVVACIAAEALGKENLTLLALPSEFSSSATHHDAVNMAVSVGAKFLDLSIQPMFEAYKEILGSFKLDSPPQTDTTLENIQARIRGTLLMAYANKTNSLLLNTGNKTELSLGYCTLYGDMNGGISILGDVSKAKVYEIAKYINRKDSVIPFSILDRAPSAELAANQTDESGLGFPYSVLSPLCDDLIEKDLIKAELLKKYSKEAIEAAENRIRISEFKRRQAPPAIRITEKAFGIGRRVPIMY